MATVDLKVLFLSCEALSAPIQDVQLVFWRVLVRVKLVIRTSMREPGWLNEVHRRYRADRGLRMLVAEDQESYLGSPTEQILTSDEDYA
jgi:hypothetical protein